MKNLLIFSTVLGSGVGQAQGQDYPLVATPLGKCLFFRRWIFPQRSYNHMFIMDNLYFLTFYAWFALTFTDLPILCYHYAHDPTAA